MSGSIQKKKRIINKELVKFIGTLPCIACLDKKDLSDDVGDILEQRYFNIAHHVQSVGSGGDDVSENLMPLDRKCHDLVHRIGLTEFAKRYSIVRLWLISAGWYYENNKGKWLRYLD